MKAKDDTWMVALVNGGSVVGRQGYFESASEFDVGRSRLAMF
jgi:hypothetical protein